MMRFFLILLWTCLSFQLIANTPKRELRGVWIATVGNIDWPSKPGLSAQQQQQEFITKLDFLQKHGFNAVVVQIRPAADAFYESPYEPWSRYLSGKQGQAPFPKYDPLKFMIEEVHKRNMEFHAWFNPFRALVNSASNPNPADHATKTHPQWLIHYAGKSYFDPGNPEARAYVIKIILDVVKRYDIDAVHIDDYFYPYPVGGKPFPDNASYNKYKNGMELGNWRRNNVNMFIAQLNSNIKNEKPHVQFGVSPFGIWRNQHQDSEGSATRGTSCYDDLYSDVKQWINNDWLDYIAPQLYWEHQHRVAAYDILLPWWVSNKGSRNLYIGLGVYRMVDGKGVWANPNEILKQIRASRQQKANGIIMYSLISFSKISNALADSLKTTSYFGNIAIPPIAKNAPKTLPETPIVSLTPYAAGWQLKWEVEKKIAHPKFLIYRFINDEKIDINNSENIIALTQSMSFIDKEASQLKNVRYVITTLDRYWNESAPSTTISYKE